MVHNDLDETNTRSAADTNDVITVVTKSKGTGGDSIQNGRMLSVGDSTIRTGDSVLLGTKNEETCSTMMSNKAF